MFAPKFEFKKTTGSNIIKKIGIFQQDDEDEVTEAAAPAKAKPAVSLFQDSSDDE